MRLVLSGRDPEVHYPHYICVFSAGGGGGLFFGILFLVQALATWVIAFLADWKFILDTA